MYFDVNQSSTLHKYTHSIHAHSQEFACYHSCKFAVTLYTILQDATVAELMKMQGVVMKKMDDQERMIREQGEMIRKLEETLKQFT